MRGGNWGRLVVAMLAALAIGSASNVKVLWAAGKPELVQDDCVKCHEGPPAAIASSGGKHKSDVTCLDCHAGHRPASKNNIPLCSQCHEGQPHYQEKGCLSCHKNPHSPLNIAFTDKLTEPCLTCHTGQIKQLRDHKSRHSALSCSKCHDVHRKKPQCTDCHKPHSAGMAQADCGKCHQAHQPRTLAYGPEVPNKDCGACHRKAFEMVAATEAKHKSVACVKCHAEKHGNIPACEQCHPGKHPASIMKQFPKCGTCHYIAHDLNNWPAGAAGTPGRKAAPKEPAAGKKKP